MTAMHPGLLMPQRDGREGLVDGAGRGVAGPVRHSTGSVPDPAADVRSCRGECYGSVLFGRGDHWRVARQPSVVAAAEQSMRAAQGSAW